MGGGGGQGGYGWREKERRNVENEKGMRRRNKRLKKEGTRWRGRGVGERLFQIGEGRRDGEMERRSKVYMEGMRRRERNEGGKVGGGSEKIQREESADRDGRKEK